MTRDEIVKALHKYAKNAQENFEVDTMRDFDSAADLIESLQAENERLAIHGGRYMQLADERYKMFERAIKRADDAETQLSASQRREKAAYAEANNAIYFSDSSDYLTALYEVCRALAPETDADCIGAKYIEGISLNAEMAKQPTFFNCSGCGCVVSDMINTCPKCGQEWEVKQDG